MVTNAPKYTLPVVLPEKVEPRDYMVRIVGRVIEAIEAGHTGILIVSPTGSGKTIMGHIIAMALHKLYGWNAGWCAMRHALWNQARGDNEDMIGFEHIKYFSSFDQTPPEGIDVLIEDEGHHSATASSASLLNKIQPKVHIALTATPDRTDAMKLCFSKMIRDVGIRSLIDQGYLSKYHHYTVEQDWTPDVVAKVYADDPARFGKSVMYFLTHAECVECQSHLADRGVRSEVVYSKSPVDDQIDKFKNGDLDVLLNMVILTEGFNAPNMKSVFIRDGSKNPTVQMGGRVLRIHEDHPYKQIIQSASTKTPFTKIASPERKFVMGDNWIWEDRGAVSNKVEIAYKKAIQMIAHTSVKKPRFSRVGQHKTWLNNKESYS